VVCRDETRAIVDRMDELLFREEMMWLQRSRISWLREGHRNTGLFHHRAKWRTRKNKIRRLKWADCTFAEAPHELQALTVGFFFEDLYTRENNV
jgi:hypothetical protein